MATHVEKQLKKNVIDDQQYHNKPLAIAMLVLFLWGPFIGMTLTLFYLSRNPEVQAEWQMPDEQRALIIQQIGQSEAE